MRTLIFILCLLLASCSSTATIKPVEEPPVAVDLFLELPGTRATLSYDLSADPDYDRILPLPKGYYGYITLKGYYFGDKLHVVHSQQTVATHFITPLVVDQPYTYALNDEGWYQQYIRLVWTRDEYGSITLTIHGLTIGTE